MVSSTHLLFLSRPHELTELLHLSQIRINKCELTGLGCVELGQSVQVGCGCVAGPTRTGPARLGSARLGGAVPGDDIQRSPKMLSLDGLEMIAVLVVMGLFIKVLEQFGMFEPVGGEGNNFFLFSGLVLCKMKLKITISLKVLLFALPFSCSVGSSPI